MIEEPLPCPEDLEQLVAHAFESANLAVPDQGVSEAVDAPVGLAAPPAEQVSAMSSSRKGLDLDCLWERKRRAADQTPGLTCSNSQNDQSSECDRNSEADREQYERSGPAIRRLRLHRHHRDITHSRVSYAPRQTLAAALLHHGPDIG